MATTTVTGPDGKDYEVTHPDGASEADIIAYAKQNYVGQAEAKPSGGFFDAIRRAKAESERIIGETGARKSILGPIITSMIPETPGQAVATGIMSAAGPASLPLKAAGRAIPPIVRTLAGAGAGAAGAAVDKGDVGSGALVGGGMTGALEAVIPGVGAGLRWGTGAKSRIANRLAQDVERFTTTQVPEMAPALQSAKAGLAPLRGGRSAAALEEVALGESGKDALSGVMERGMLDATLAAQGQGVSSPSLMKAWKLLPSGNVVSAELKRRLAPSPSGTFSVGQAERLLAELGDAAFKGEAASPIARGVGGLELRKLYGSALNETVSGLPQQAAGVFAQARDKYKAGMSILDMLRKGTARQGGPNRITLNEPQIQKYLSENRAELRTKLGPAFDELVDIINRGGQLGTRSIMTPGTGETLSALRQVYGRGQGGAPQLIGSAARTVLPNLGYQPTGRAPYAAPDQLKILLDILGISATTGGTP